MAVLFQELLVPEISFILHTGGIDRPTSTQDKEDDQHQLPDIYAELAPGLGEILASARTRGSAYRMLIDRETGRLRHSAVWRRISALQMQCKSVL